MKSVETVLNEELRVLKGIVKEAKRRLESAPKGRLRIRRWKGVLEYYYKAEDEKRSNGRYLKRNEIECAKRIAQRDYDVQIVKSAEERINVISGFLKKYERTCLEEIYLKTNELRRELILPVVLPDEEYIKQWLAVEYKGKRFEEGAPEIITERGERVRSKSEKIIADKLYALGIAYRYECPLVLDGNVRIYPDFTILKMPEREEVYLEHFGMLDDNNYVEGMLYKLKTYERNGIYLGVNLFMTHETGKDPLNTRTLDRLIRALWC